MALGPMATSVGATLKRLGVNPTTDARGQLAFALATCLDSNPEAAAPLARELRMTLSELEARHRGDENDELDRFLAGLSSEVEHAKE